MAQSLGAGKKRQEKAKKDGQTHSVIGGKSAFLPATVQFEAPLGPETAAVRMWGEVFQLVLGASIGIVGVVMFSSFVEYVTNEIMMTIEEFRLLQRQIEAIRRRRQMVATTGFAMDWGGVAERRFGRRGPEGAAGGLRQGRPEGPKRGARLTD
ncbi:MAG: hypothetical protein AB2556_19735 [Candidatus Thiodiazotropha sp.]